jgi:signal transduction histidine kinase/ActR/RegA family two-component response regulator
MAPADENGPGVALAGPDSPSSSTLPVRRSLLPWLARSSDRLLPPVLRDAAPDVLLRARFLAAMALISFVPTLMVLAVALSMGWYQVLVPMAVRMALLAAAEILLWRRGRIELPGHMLLCAELTFVLWGAYDTRALFPLMALCVLPMGALLLCGRRAGWAWLLVTCALSVVMVLAFDVRAANVASLAPVLIAPVQLAAVVFVLGWIYDVLKQRSLQELEHERQQALARERRIHESERRALEAEHARAQALARAKIEESFRMASLGTLSAGVAHEINNPLAFVMANVQFLGDMLRDVEHLLPAAQRDEMQEIFADTSDGLARIRRIVRDLSTFSRTGEHDAPDAGLALDGASGAGGSAIDVRTIDVRTVVEAAVNLAQSQLGQNARLARDYQPVPPVDASKPQLAQVFLNLLINASQAIPAGARDASEIVVRTGTDAAGRAFVEVRDTGVGIPAEHLPRLFDPFFTTRPQGEGMGLGLSICHGIVTQLGGAITVESEVGRGSTFRVSLPASANPMPTTGVQVALPRARGASVAGQEPALRILVVDDEAAVGRVMARMLGGHEVHVAVSGRDVMALLDHDSDFDVIFCDLMMAGVSGMDLYTHVMRVHPALVERFVFITGGAFTPSAQAFVAAHAHACLTKPLDGPAVQAQLARVLAQPRADRRAAR